MVTAQEQLSKTIGNLVIENAQLREERDRAMERLATEITGLGTQAEKEFE